MSSFAGGMGGMGGGGGLQRAGGSFNLMTSPGPGGAAMCPSPYGGGGGLYGTAPSSPAPPPYTQQQYQQYGGAGGGGGGGGHTRGLLRTSSLNTKKSAPNRVCCNALLAAYARATPTQVRVPSRCCIAYTAFALSRICPCAFQHRCACVGR